MGVASYPVEEADVSTLLHPPDGGQSSCHVLLSLSPWVVYPLPCSRGMSFQGYCRDLVFFLTEIQEGAHVKHHIRTDDHPKQFAYQASPEKRADIEHHPISQGYWLMGWWKRVAVLWHPQWY